jgi:hypothetical protein
MLDSSLDGIDAVCHRRLSVSAQHAIELHTQRTGWFPVELVWCGSAGTVMCSVRVKTVT